MYFMTESRALMEPTEADVSSAILYACEVADLYHDLKPRPWEPVLRAVLAERKRCANIAGAYGREGNQPLKGSACEVADEIAAWIRSGIQ